MFFYISNQIDKNIKNNQLFKNKLNKFDIYKDLISNNYNEELIKIFIKSQNIYHTLNKFTYYYKLKNFKSNNETDLYFENFNLKKSSLKLLVDNKIFTFSVNDINYLINMNLLYYSNNNYISQYIRNPYTNKKFKLNNLYNIYFFLRNNSYSINILYHLFYKKNFNLSDFKFEYKFLILQSGIKNIITTAKHDFLYDSIIEMFTFLETYFYSIYFLNYDQETIIIKYRKYLYYYFCYKNYNMPTNIALIYKLTLLKKIYNLIQKDKILDVIKNHDTFIIINNYDNILNPITYNSYYNNTTTSVTNISGININVDEDLNINLPQEEDELEERQQEREEEYIQDEGEEIQQEEEYREEYREERQEIENERQEIENERQEEERETQNRDEEINTIRDRNIASLTSNFITIKTQYYLLIINAKILKKYTKYIFNLFNFTIRCCELYMLYTIFISIKY